MKHRTIEEIYKSAHTYAEWDLVPNKDSTIQAMKMYAEQECVEFLEWATGRNLEVSLGVFVDNEGTYDSMEEYYGLYLQSKGNVV